jgi:diaminopimelate epimerase
MAMELKFYKFEGTGNDFVILDAWLSSIDLDTAQIKFICDRKFGVGADGLMVLVKAKDLDFEMLYFNSDGLPGSMCGNGGRCLVKYAFDRNYTKAKANFLAPDGIHDGIMINKDLVSLGMRDVSFPKALNNNDWFVNTGSPHLIRWVDDVEGVDVYNEGKSIRNSKDFIENGVNVNFVCVSENSIRMRTYERGVEDETLSCGTGVTAAVIAAVFAGKISDNLKEVKVVTQGGELSVLFERGIDNFYNVRLNGPAKKVFEGVINL